MARTALVNLIVVVAAVGAGLAASQQPWRVLRQQESRTAQQVREMRESESQRALLVRQEARYRSSIGREELARERGLLPANEVFVMP